jgi:hypothetical protein
MLEFLPFLHHCGAYQLTDGYHLSDADLGESAGILALGETLGIFIARQYCAFN